MWVVSFIRQLWGNRTCTFWKGGWVGPRSSVDILKKLKMTVNARNRGLDRPAHSIATILTDLSQLFSTNMKDNSKYSRSKLKKIPCYFNRVMINIRHVSHDSAACYLMVWRHLLTLFSTLKKEAVGSSETLVMRYHSEQYTPIFKNSAVFMAPELHD